MPQYQARVVHRDVIWGSSNGKVDGVTIIPSFDEVNNFATLEIPDCETRIKYRAFDRFRAKHQKQLPGLTIQAPKHAEVCYCFFFFFLFSVPKLNSRGSPYIG